MPEETYRFDEAAYDTLGRAGVGWQSVLDVLHARPRLRQHIGSVLRIAAPDRTGRWTTPNVAPCRNCWKEADRDEYPR
jgi:hypothetical protein